MNEELTGAAATIAAVLLQRTNTGTVELSDEVISDAYAQAYRCVKQGLRKAAIAEGPRTATVQSLVI